MPAATIPVGQLLFRVFKYGLYTLLTWNIWLFYLEDSAASALIYAEGITWANLVQAHPATTDTLSWVLLLLMFELETAVIPDRYLRGKLKWLLLAVRSVCYLAIIYAFYGYAAKLGVVTALQPVPATDACSLVGQGYSTIESLDNYPALTVDNCAAVGPGALQVIKGSQVLVAPAEARLIAALAWADVINAGTWLLVVLLLELEVMLQLGSALSDARVRMLAGSKLVLYGTLFLCALYWGVDGEFLDFWDAFLWLVAFVFIELNIFQWRDEQALEAADERQQA